MNLIIKRNKRIFHCEGEKRTDEIEGNKVTNCKALDERLLRIIKSCVVESHKVDEDHIDYLETTYTLDLETLAEEIHQIMNED